MFSSDFLHHAYFIEGDRRAVLADIEKFLYESFKIIRRGHPDVHYSEHESFGIDESRRLRGMQSMKPVLGGKKIFIIAFDGLTDEAQNSLLKIFEEPTPETHFFVISSSARMLLPTLRSRVVVIFHSSAKNISPGDNEAERFVAMSPRDRLVFVASMAEKKDRTAAEMFLKALIAELHEKKLETRAKSIREIVSLAKYVKDRSPSLKLILERVALLDL
ncbi:MAG: hypothetical protein AAB775_00300 [Patescibacteria group bacterium]